MYCATEKHQCTLLLKCAMKMSYENSACDLDHLGVKSLAHLDASVRQEDRSVCVDADEGASLTKRSKSTINFFNTCS